MFGNYSFNNQPSFNRNTNKIPANSLEDALSRYTDFNSNMVYWDVNKNVIYDVYTDGRGNKTYDIINISKVEQIVKDEPKQDYETRFKNIEQKLEELYGKYNAQQQSGTISESTNV